MKDKNYKWIIALLLVVIILQLLIKFPINVNIVQTKTDCPKTICKDVKVNCECRCLNGTLKEPKVSWNGWFYDDWDGRTYTFNNSIWNWTNYGGSWINASDYYKDCKTCWSVHRN